MNQKLPNGTILSKLFLACLGSDYLLISGMYKDQVQIQDVSKRIYTLKCLSSVGDPGFHRGGVPTPTYCSAKFFQKQHENEDIGHRGGARVQNFTVWISH